MVKILFKTIFNCLWVLIKPCLFVIIPVAVVFSVAFGIAYYQKKKSGTAVRKVIAHTNPKADYSLFTKIFVQLPRQFWKNYYNKEVGEFREHGIIMFTGAQGQGKTIGETKYLMDMQYRYPSCRVILIMDISLRTLLLNRGEIWLIITTVRKVLSVLLMNVKTGLVRRCQRTFRLVCLPP